jgi:hypothetical protein
MDLLPPVGWADIATKTDLSALEERMELRFDAVNLRFEALEYRFDAKLEHEIRELTRTLLLGLIGAMATMTTLCLGAIALTP